jgi:outer membrane protein assembly factor BamB
MDLSINELVWTTSFRLGNKTYFTGNYIFCNQFLNDTKLFSLDLKTGKELWTFDVSQFENYISRSAAYIGEERPESLRKIIGIYKENLYLGLASGRIIALDIHTGNVLKEWWKMKQPHKNFKRIGTGNLRLDKEKGEIFCILNYYCWKIDLKTEELSFYDYLDYCREEKISFNAIHSSLYENHIIGLATKELEEEDEYHSPYTEPYIIALNRATFKIDWKYQLDKNLLEEEGTTTAPIFAGKNMYFALNGTLHVFEKT